MRAIDSTKASIAVAALLFTYLITATVARAECSAPVELGFAFTHYRITDGPGARCDIANHKPNVSRRDNVVLNDDDPEVKSVVAEKLTQMADAGARVLRVFVWFSEKKDEDVLGVVALGDEKAEARAANAVASILGEAKRVGYKDVVVAFGPVGEADPKCRRREWGDCFDQSTLPNSERFVDRVIRAVNEHGQGKDVIYELGSEMCPRPQSRFAAGPNTTKFLEAVLATHANYRFVVSCVGANARDLRDRLDTLASIYSRLHVRPYAVDIHIYEPSESIDERMLAVGQEAATRLRVPLIIGETSVGHTPLLQAITQLHSRGELHALKAVLFWPTRFGTHCAFSANIPFDFSDWAKALTCHK